MRILVMNDSLAPRGGTELYCRSMLEALVQRGHDVLAWSADGHRPPALPEACAWESMPELFSASLHPRSLRTAVRAWNGFRDRVERAAPDMAALHHLDTPQVVRWLESRVPTARFVHTAWTYCPAGTRWLPRSAQACTRAPGVACLAVDAREQCLTAADGTRFAPKTRLRRVLDMRLQRSLYRHAAVTVVNSDYTRRELLQFLRGVPARVVTLDPPVQARRAVRRVPVPGRLLCVGRLVPIKGVDHALRALSVLPGASLDVVGDGPQAGWLRQRAEELGVAGRTRFLGWLPPDGVEQAVQDAEVVLVTTLAPETFGLAGAEAVLSGRPVVAYDLGGVGAWLEPGAGVKVEAGNWRALARAAQGLLAQGAPARDRVADAAGPLARRLSLQAFAQGWERIMAEACRAWRDPPDPSARGERN